MENTHSLIQISKDILSFTEGALSKNTAAQLRSAIKELENRPYPLIQLYSVSQAGKSTFFSLLTNGDQYVPVGSGKATTAVTIELIDIGDEGVEKAEIEWLSPEELLTQVIDILGPIVKSLGGSDEGKPARRKTNSISLENLGLEALMTAEGRRPFFKALVYAKRAKNLFRTPGSGGDLALAELILTYFASYRREYREGLQTIALDELDSWTRQPHDWSPDWREKKYPFKELRCFFTRRVLLHTRVHPFAQGLRIIDSPGFNVSLLHDKICRRVQQEADAILLVLGKGGGETVNAELAEIQQMALGFSERSERSPEVFVLWNPKSGKRFQSQNLLAEDLKKLGHIGIQVSETHAVVANLRLALRSIQGKRLSGTAKPELSEITIRALQAEARTKLGMAADSNRLESGRTPLAQMLIEADLLSSFAEYEDPLVLEQIREEAEDRYHDIYQNRKQQEPDISRTACRKEAELDVFCAAGEIHSDWKEGVGNLFHQMRDRVRNPRLEHCVACAVAALAEYQSTFPSPHEYHNPKKNAEVAQLLLEELNEYLPEYAVNWADNESFKAACGTLCEILVNHYFTDSEALTRLKNVIRATVDDSSSYLEIPGKAQGKVKDYVNTRVDLWAKSLQGDEAVRGNLKGMSQLVSDTLSVAQLRLSDARANQGLTMLITPEFRMVQPDLSGFLEQLKTAHGLVSASVLTLDMLEKFVSWVSEKVKQLGKSIERGWKAFLTKITGQEYKVVETPVFNKELAKEELVKKIDILFDREALLAVLLADTNAFRQPSAIEQVRAILTATLNEGVNNGQLDPGSIWDTANEHLQNRRLQLLSEFNGPFREAMTALVNMLTASRKVWREKVEAELNRIRTLCRQQEGAPAPLTKGQLDQLEQLAGSLAHFVGFGEVESTLCQLRDEVTDLRNMHTALTGPPSGKELSGFSQTE